MRLFLIIIISFQAAAQNLVPNPSFEDYFNCPDNITRHSEPGDSLLPFWYSPSNGSTDYYNSCTKSYKAKTGDNWVGSAEAYDGNGFIGLLLEDEVREYLQTHLTHPLEKGKKYTISFYVRHADKTARSIAAFSFYLSRENVLMENYQSIFVKPSAVVVNTIADTEWQRVEATYTATGGEQFLTLGNTARNVSSKVVNKKAEYQYCYYYIDNVEVVENENVVSQIELANNQFHVNELKNLVYNGGFEYADDPIFPMTRWGNVADFRIGPFWYSVGLGTADFIYNNGALEIRGAGVSPRFFKFEREILENLPFSGVGMGGLRAFQEPTDTTGEYYEYLQGELKEPLVKGKKYYVSYKIRSAGFAKYAVNQFGLKFYSERQYKHDYDKVETPADIKYAEEKEINYHDGWVEINGWYAAKGGETHFKVGAITEKPVISFNNYVDGSDKDGKSFDKEYAYYFVDDVIVTEDSSSVGSALLNEPRKNFIILLDASGSMESDGYLENSETAILELMQFVNPGDRVSLIQLGQKTEILFTNHNPKDYHKLSETLDKIKAKGETSYKDGLLAAAEVIKQEDDKENYVILITNGKMQMDGADQAVARLRQQKIKFYPVIYTAEEAVSKKLLEHASVLKGDIFSIGDGDVLSAMLAIFAMD